MIGSIDSDSDIELYLEAEEIKKLRNKRIEGVLIKIANPRQQGTISISLDEERKNKQGFGVGVDDKKYWGLVDDFHVDTFIGNYFYQKLINKGEIGTRFQIKDGSKISIYDKSKISGFDLLHVDKLEFYRDNKQKLK